MVERLGNLPFLGLAAPVSIDARGHSQSTPTCVFPEHPNFTTP